MEFKITTQAQKKQRILCLTLLSCVAFLIVFGLFMVYSASFYSAKVDFNDELYYLKRQLIGTVGGLALMVIMCFINYEKLKKFWIIGMIVAIVLLALIFIPGVGVENFGARRWIKLFGGFTLQPSEVAKFAYILFAASYMSRFKSFTSKFWGLLPLILGGGVLAVLIMLEPNMSITICIVLLMLGMMFIGGTKIKHFILILVPLVLCGALLIVAEPYRFKRLLAFIDPWASPLGEGFQLIQSLYALGSGGFFGVGYCNSRQKFDFLPFSESDFIFSIIGEEFGFVGAALVFLVYLVIIICGCKIALNAKSRFGTYLAVGIVTIIGVQVAINVAVVSGAIPPTGLPLPFVSYGNTAQLFFLGAIGVLVNICKNSDYGIFSRDYKAIFSKKNML